MLACVTFAYVEGFAGKELSEEEDVLSLVPSSVNVALRFAGRAVRKKKTSQ